MISAPYAGPIENVVVVMLERRSYGDVLDALEAAMMPIATFLGRQFMLCDGWVVSSPRARANMLTANCAAHGNSERGVVDLEPNLFSALDAARGVRFGARGTRVPNWKVYFHDYSILGNALAYVARCYDDPANLNVANYDERDYPPGARNPLAAPTTTFLQDVAQNVLPAYAFIEPRHRSGRWDPSRDESTGDELLLALMGQLDPVRDRIAKDVDEQVRKALEDRPVELRLRAVHDQLDLLAGLDREIADSARKRPHD